jgi:hypothetical protein
MICGEGSPVRASQKVLRTVRRLCTNKSWPKNNARNGKPKRDFMRNPT